MTDSPLELAAQKGDIDAIKAALEAHAEKGTAYRQDIGNALSWAAYQGHLEAVKCLIEAGADPFGVNHSALNLALTDHHEAIVSFLEEVRAVEKAAFLEVLNAQTDIKEWVRQPYKDTDEVPLLRACKMRCFDEVAAKMAAAGDGLTYEDVLRYKSNEGKDTLLQVAIGDLQLKKILAPKLWRGRLEEIKRVWDLTTEFERKFQGIEFGSIVAEYNQMMLKTKRPVVILRGFKPG